MSRPVIAIVGRPNVGKSTLFNRLVGFRKAMVHDRPGVTRDRLYETTELGDRSVMLIDTGGIEARPDTDLLLAMRRQSLVAVEEADCIVFLVDGRAGFTPADAEVAAILRRTDRPVILAVNKVDGPAHEDLAAEFWQVGISPLLTISAEHSRGMYELEEAILERLPAPVLDPVEHEIAEADEAESAEGDEEAITLEDAAAEELDLPVGREAFSGPIRIAVIGRPNIGKSTLINSLVGSERHLVHDSPGTTTDPVDSPLTVNGKEYLLVDTAGVRRKSKIDDPLERWVSLRSIRAIERCHVTLLLVDATVGPSDQDARLASLVLDRGRAIVIVINKWDLTKGNEDIDIKSVEDHLQRKLPHLSFAPRLYISAKTGRGVNRVLPMIDQVFQSFNKRLSTSKVNRFLDAAIHAHSPPQLHHHPVRLYYGTQSRVRPPSFVFFSNTPDGIPESYTRYLQNRLREELKLVGTPIRVRFRSRRRLGEPT